VIGVFGGSGFYSFLDDIEERVVETPYGPPSAPVAVGAVGGVAVAFLPRHGVDHQFPPHVVNWRANLWAMRELGVTRLLGPCAAGSLQPGIHPGDFVVLDQLVDRTWGRGDSYFDGPVPGHIGFADPYCPELRSVVVRAAGDEDLGIKAHDGGTAVVIQGPRFSTRAESAWFRAQAWEVVNMTQYPEAYLARELGICYSGIALVTDYDTGVEHDASIGPVTMDDVFEVLRTNVDRTRSLLMRVIPAVPAERGSACACAEALSQGPLGS
jgi:5'-methylthioadenosine phosphorylase